MNKREREQMTKAVMSLAGLLMAGAAALWGCGSLPEAPAGGGGGPAAGQDRCTDEWRSGVPQSDVRGVRSLCREEYVAVFDPALKVSRVVGEYLRPAEMDGSVSRTDNFQPDPDLAPGEGPELNDYRRSGYDRGHLAPAADFTSSAQAMAESFYLSNMVPQEHEMNAGVWAALESATRACAQEQGGVYVLTGPLFGAQPERIGEGGVAVPDSLFKVVVAGEQARAFVIPNRENLPSRTDFAPYEVTAEMVENLSGLTLFPQGGVQLDRTGTFCRGAFGG